MLYNTLDVKSLLSPGKIEPSPYVAHPQLMLETGVAQAYVFVRHHIHYTTMAANLAELIDLYSESEN